MRPSRSPLDDLKQENFSDKEITKQNTLQKILEAITLANDRSLEHEQENLLYLSLLKKGSPAL